MEKIELKLDENNELVFKILIEGTTEPATSVRFVCESDDGVSYMFNGFTTDEPGEIVVNVPPMKGRLGEGEYKSSLEMVVDGKYHAPLQVVSQFKSGVRVVAESVRRTEEKKEFKPQVSVTQVKSKPAEQRQTVPVVPTKRVTLADKYNTKKIGH